MFLCLKSKGGLPPPVKNTLCSLKRGKLLLVSGTAVLELDWPLVRRGHLSDQVSWLFPGNLGMWLQSPRERPVGFEFLSPRENLKAVLPPSENAQEERLTVRNL